MGIRRSPFNILGTRLGFERVHYYADMLGMRFDRACRRLGSRGLSRSG